MKQGTLSLSPLRNDPADKGGIVTTTFGISEKNGLPFFAETVRGRFTPDGGGPDEILDVEFWLPSGKPSTLGGLVRSDAEGWPLAHGAPKPSVGGHEHQILARVNRARVRCSLEQTAPATEKGPAKYEAFSWEVSAPVSFDAGVAGSPLVRAAEGVARPPRITAETEVDGI
jgi:hypothetical protein